MNDTSIHLKMNDVQAGAGPARSQTTRTQQVCRIESAYTRIIDYMRYNRIQMRHTAKITCVSESERSSESSKRQGDGYQRVWGLMHMSAD